MMESLFFLLYRAVAWPAMRLAFSILARFNEKIMTGLAMRARDGSGRWPWLATESATRPVWIHCASGEFEYAKPVITLLKKRSPETKILVTYFSPSFAAAVKKFPGVDFACPLPWETPTVLREFLTWHRPRALLIARTDTWPEMLRQAKLAGLPTLLFSASLPENAGRARGLGRWQSKVVFRFLDQIMCVSEADRKVFAGLGASERTVVAGDTRYDQVQARLLAPKPLKERLFAEPTGQAPPLPTFVAGSTWPEDEAVLIDVAVRMKTQARFVLVPHEPSSAHLEELERLLRQQGLRSVRYSQQNDVWPDGAILLVDQIGILAELYSKGRFAFVGGSFRKTVHSVMEPLAAGCLTFVGPFHWNNREALEFKALGGVIEASGADSLCAALAKAVSQTSDETAHKLKREVGRRSGGSERVVNWCLERLKN